MLKIKMKRYIITKRLYLEAFYTIANNSTINRSIDVPQQLIPIVRNCMQQNP